MATTEQPAIQAEPGNRRPDYKSIVKSLVSRLVFVYFISSLFKRSKDPPVQNGQLEICKSTNILYPNQLLDLYFFITEDDEPFNKSNLIWHQENLVYNTQGMFSNNETFFNSQIVLNEYLQNNGSIYGHFYIVKHGNSPFSNDSNYDETYTFFTTKRLNKYKKKIYKKTHNLLTGETTDLEAKKKIESGTKSEIISHWHPNITLNIIVDNTSWVPGKIPQPIDQHIQFFHNDICHYKPILYINDFWNLIEDYYPINSTLKTLNVSFTFNPITMFKWQLYVSQDFKNKWVSILTEGIDPTSGEDPQDENKDAFKKALIETNPYLLMLTIIVSIVHSVFEILAFKNDIQFWKNRQSLEGLSIRSVFFNIFTSLVVLLYVMDNETNFMVKVTLFVGLLIDVWKITRCFDISLDTTREKILGIIPMINFKLKSTYLESDTKKYDKLAFKYLSWLLFPLLIGYSVYSIIYQEHKSWYSFVLNILYGYLLTFGFIMMTPQLFINYKLKSVAHLPWRMLTYKALNTFIDDIFAFVIKMPTMYRIGCFRDDIIFFIYLYQRWIYRTDMKRMNEFGITGDATSSQKVETIINTAIEKTPALEDSKAKDLKEGEEIDENDISNSATESNLASTTMQPNGDIDMMIDNESKLRHRHVK